MARVAIECKILMTKRQSGQARSLGAMRNSIVALDDLSKAPHSHNLAVTMDDDAATAQ